MDRLTVLFVCIGNSCRSPMAEAIARALGGKGVDARSAGLSPLGWISKATIDTLRCLGYSADGLSSKGLNETDLEGVDIIVSLLGERGLEFIPRELAARREGWAIDDPFGEDEELYLEVARELELRIRHLLDEEGALELSSP